jgi:hypothetical protein
MLEKEEVREFARTVKLIDGEAHPGVRRMARSGFKGLQ